MSELREVFKSTGISVELTLTVWDALKLSKHESTCTMWEKTATRGVEGFVLVTNFSRGGRQDVPQTGGVFSPYISACCRCRCYASVG